MKLLFPALVLFTAASTIAACTGSDPVLSDVDTDSGTTPETDSGGTPADSSMPSADGGVDSADAAKTFCDTQAPLTGVTDFLCADFDGTSLTKGWTKSILPDGGSGAFVTNTDIFTSPPNSLSTTGNALLEWDAAGAAPLIEVDATFKVNVGTLGGVVGATSGSVQILSLDAGNEQTLTLSYTNGGGVQGQPVAYNGYYVTAVDCSNACSLSQFALAPSLTPNVWTQVEVTWTKTGNVRVLFNGIQVGNQPAFFPTSTKLAATLGLLDVGASPAIPRHAFDDVMFSVRR